MPNGHDSGKIRNSDWSWDSPCSSSGGWCLRHGGLSLVAGLTSGSPPAQKRHFPAWTSCRHPLVAAPEPQTGESGCLIGCLYLFIFIWHLLDFILERKREKASFFFSRLCCSARAAPSLPSACLPLTTTVRRRRMLAGAGCVSSPMATSCYSNGPELIGRQRWWWRYGETYGGIERSWVCLHGSSVKNRSVGREEKKWREFLLCSKNALKMKERVKTTNQSVISSDTTEELWAYSVWHQ